MLYSHNSCPDVTGLLTCAHAIRFKVHLTQTKIPIQSEICVYFVCSIYSLCVLLTLLNNVKICHYVTCISAVRSVSLSIFIILFALLCILVCHFSAWFIEICKWLGINVPRNPDNTVKHFKCSINPLKWFEFVVWKQFPFWTIRLWLLVFSLVLWNWNEAPIRHLAFQFNVK